jgi:uncharacterized damage-inducible protein DinB
LKKEFDMSISTGLLPEFDHEMATTRTFLACLPEDKLGWQPHPKSATVGHLAGHLATMTSMVSLVLTTEGIDMAGIKRTPPPETRAGLLSLFDENAAAARAAIAATADADFQQTWTMRAGDKIIFSMPRLAVLRTMVFSHMIHHRAQLGLYYRLLDISVPQTYGPTADHKM